VSLRSVLACCLAALAVVAAGCGSDPPEDTGGKVRGDRLAIFSSQPFQGPEARVADQIVNGEKLALADAGGKVGRWEIEYRALDDSTAAANGWEPGQVSFNARKAAIDPLTIAYIGELNAEASAIAIPILNEADILVVSPWATNIGLTEDGLGAEKGEPDKHFPNTNRTFGRVIPNDRLQSQAIATLMREQGVKRLYIVNDRQPYGRSLALQVSAEAKDQGIEVVDASGVDGDQDQFRAVAQEARDAQADAIFVGATMEDNAPRLFTDLRLANPTAKLFGPGALADPAFAARLPAAMSNVWLTAPALPPDQLPPAGRRFVRDYTRAYGEPPGPAAAHGYEAMAAVLQAIRDAGANGNDRKAVNKAFHELKRTDSVLGDYEILPSGDATLDTFAVYTVGDRRLRFERTIKVEAER
jgi:branched-chain amino acid transport system substrate-binding protein